VEHPVAQVTNSYSTYDSVGQREDLSDVIHMITPEETPMVRLIGKGKKADAKYTEWQTDVLGTPRTDGVVEGDEYTYDAVTPTVRVGNYCQIQRRSVIVTGSNEAVAKAGRKSDLAREVRKKGVLLRKDQELTILSNQASVAGDDVTARKLGGFPAWLTSNDSRGATGADGGFSAGIVAAAGNGTQRAFTKALLDDCIQVTYTSGGNPTTAMMSVYNKRVFSTFMSDENVIGLRKAHEGKKQATLVGAADMYVSDFGTLDIVPNRVMTEGGAGVARNIFLVTPDMVELAELRPINIEEPAKTGDATKKVLLVEYTLRVHNQAAHGVIADTFGLTAST
jgi:hypothetical protein